MSAVTHAPTPWKQGAANEDAEMIYDAQDEIVASAENIAVFRRTPESEGRENANAALIVRAVNCHKDLLAALVELHIWITWPSNEFSPTARSLEIYERMLARSNAAIAKAKGR